MQSDLSLNTPRFHFVRNSIPSNWENIDAIVTACSLRLKYGSSDQFKLNEPAMALFG